MKRCSFCGEARNKQDLLSSRPKRSTRICNDCLKTCRDILAGVAVRQRSGIYRLVATERSPTFRRCCSFCGHPMKLVERMFRSRLDHEHYICSRCISESEDLLAKPARKPYLSRLLRLFRRTNDSRLIDLSGSDQQLT